MTSNSILRGRAVKRLCAATHSVLRSVETACKVHLFKPLDERILKLFVLNHNPPTKRLSLGGGVKNCNLNSAFYLQFATARLSALRNEHKAHLLPVGEEHEEGRGC